ncbi:MAG: hypothetical protein M3Z03_13185, partial [Actinomycetota bacterium]|nr:hypothetical protein [Actinomycetota bacterium]
MLDRELLSVRVTPPCVRAPVVEPDEPDDELFLDDDDAVSPEVPATWVVSTGATVVVVVIC